MEKGTICYICRDHKRDYIIGLTGSQSKMFKLLKVLETKVVPQVQKTECSQATKASMGKRRFKQVLVPLPQLSLFLKWLANNSTLDQNQRRPTLSLMWWLFFPEQQYWEARFQREVLCNLILFSWFIWHWFITRHFKVSSVTLSINPRQNVL